MGEEVAALGPLLDSGTISLRLALRASATVSRSEGPRSRVTGFGRTLEVEPDLEALPDEGRLSVEAATIRAVSPALALSVDVHGPHEPELGSFEARAEAVAAALLVATGKAGDEAIRRAASIGSVVAARASSPCRRPVRGDEDAAALTCLVSGIDGSRPLAIPEGRPTFVSDLALFRDPHGECGPSPRLAVLGWHSGDPVLRHALRAAASASRAAARALSRGTTGALLELLERESRALEALAPPSPRERRAEALLREAGAVAIRRIGERGLLAVLVPQAQRATVENKALGLGLETIRATPGEGGIEVEEVAA
jgi:hypothetical protein